MVCWKRKCISCKKYFLQDQTHFGNYCSECVSKKKVYFNKFSEGVMDNENKEN
jgi:hypothetical protein